MIYVVAENYIKEENLDKVIKLYEELVGETRKEKGCIKYELCQDEKDKTVFAMMEEWESKEDLESHLNSEHFKRLVPEISKLSAKAGVVNIYKKVL